MSLLSTLPDLPVKTVLPQLMQALENSSNAVLVAPPGAGKTTLVPLALLEADWCKGQKILVLEPRRLAARAAANRMADLLGEKVGQRVGYRVRFDTRVSGETLIEVVTEGVFTRILATNPGLEGIGAVLFDEFHERSLEGDLALALCLDLQAGLREDLRLLPMSATLDGSAVAALMQASIIESEGRQFPVDISYQDKPPREAIEVTMARAIRQQIAQQANGSVLAFLPGQREIERTADLLEGKFPPEVELHRLYGAISQNAQDAAIRPPQAGNRKVVLASSIAETSLTIDGVDTVIDSGLSRQPVFEPATGLTRLQTVRAAKAAIDQRAGRAGRLGPGRAIRLWREQQTVALPAYAPPEILNADLSSLLLDLADWGVSDPATLCWLDAPPAAARNEARVLLQEMGALGERGLSEHGKAIRNLALPPRLAHMVLKASRLGAAGDASLLALALQERGAGGAGVDLDERLQRLKQAGDGRSNRVATLAKSIAAKAGNKADLKQSVSTGILLAFAYPERIAQRGAAAPQGAIRYRLANGRGAELSAEIALAKTGFIVVADMAGRAGAARILAAAEITKADLYEHFSHLIHTKTESRFDKQSAGLISQSATRLGSLMLDKPKPVQPDPDEACVALLAALQNHGLDLLPWRDADRGLRNKLAFLHHYLPDIWRAMDDEALLDNLDDWLAPFLIGHTSFAPLSKGALSDALMLHVGQGREREIASTMPSHFNAPSGSSVPIRYQDEKAVLSIRPQELFGLSVHPAILNDQVPLELELLSPAGRPIQITRDLPGFWRGSWRDVRADLRGRYPKHPWPENPLEALPTKRVKPRKS